LRDGAWFSTHPHSVNVPEMCLQGAGKVADGTSAALGGPIAPHQPSATRRSRACIFTGSSTLGSPSCTRPWEDLSPRSLRRRLCRRRDVSWVLTQKIVPPKAPSTALPWPRERTKYR